MPNRFRQYRSAITALAAALVASSCGGGGGGGDSAAPAVAIATSSRPVEQSDLQIAESIYSGSARTPSGFYADATPSGHAYVATAHVKNTDVDSSVNSSQPLYELCTDDWNEALSWSEASAQNSPQYAALVETNDDTRYFEFGRVRDGQPEFYVRSRIFKCAYLDRRAANLRATGGAAGQINLKPFSANELRNLSEYLWQFTTYNNFGHVVLKSSGGTGSTGLNHTLHIASLVRNGVSSSCDRIDVVSWRHSADNTGRLQLELQTLWSFGARDAGGGVAQLCT